MIPPDSGSVNCVYAELEDQRQKKARGNSIYAEYRTFQNVAEAGFMAMAAVSSPTISQKKRRALHFIRIREQRGKMCLIELCVLCRHSPKEI